MKNEYLNPVYPFECADPYAISFDGSFWIYRTGHWQDGRIFGILRSTDLVNWEPVGPAMDPLPDNPPYYWAPEVYVENGIFYLYYSAGNEVNMHMRVATSRAPQGPFVDSGRRLTSEVFAIDGHVFVDEDGRRYFFYATDFLEVDRVGTGTVMDRMIDPFTLEGRPSPVALAKYDWQIYDPRRAEKNNLRWHTIEGSFALKRKGRYYQMFSGGNYQQPTYGVGYAVTDDIRNRVEWEQHIDGEAVYPILRTVAGEVTGPGHNSVVAGPDNRQLFCVYHVIKPQKSFERVLSVDRLEWVGDRLVVLGPSYTPRPAPNRAIPLSDLKHEVPGSWQVSSRAIAQPQSASASLDFSLEYPAFLFQCWIRLLPGSEPGGTAGVVLNGPAGELLRVAVNPSAQALEITQAGSPLGRLDLPGSFDATALHRLRVDVNCREVSLLLDEIDITWKGRLPALASSLGLWTAHSTADFSAPQVTYGWEDSFADGSAAAGPAGSGGILPAQLEAAGWAHQGEGDWQVSGGLLVAQCAGGEQALLVKDIPMVDYEWVVNFRVLEGSCVWLFPSVEAGAQGMPHKNGIQFLIENGSWSLRPGSQPAVVLPPGFDGYEFNQLRVRKQDGQIQVALLDQEIGVWPAPAGETCTALGVDSGSRVAFDMVRLTRL